MSKKWGFVGLVSNSLLVGGKAGKGIQDPMAIVILGGLLTSTFLNLVVSYCVYWEVGKHK